MVDYAPPWDALPRDTSHASHDIPVEQIRRSAATLATLLDEKKEEQVLKEACLGLCQLFGEGIQNDRIQAILEADVVPKLVDLLRPSRARSVPISVQLAALQVLGNVACGDDQQTQVVIDSDALPCLRALLFSSDRQIRKEVCWIVSNITESSHQVQDVLDADILPPLLKLLDNQDGACREDATWVLFNLSSNRVPKQITYLAENDGIRALCNLLTCQKELDVLWKGCGTVAAVALKGLRNVLVSGQIVAASKSNGQNEMAALVAEAHGVERIEALTSHASPDVRNRARLILERIFGTEPSTLEPPQSFPFHSAATHANTAQACASPPLEEHMRCSCSISRNLTHYHHAQSSPQYRAQGLYGLNRSSCTSSISANPLVSHGITSTCIGNVHSGSEVINSHDSTSGSSTDSDPDDDDSDSDLMPPPPTPCNCLLCTDVSPLVERRPRGKGTAWDDSGSFRRSISTGVVPARFICSFCSGGGRLGDGRAGLAAKLGRAVRLGHPHCLAIILSRMTWGQRMAATEAPALLHPGGGPPDGGVGSSLPAVILSAQLGKPSCLSLLLKRCQPNLDLTYGKRRLTALAWAAHKGYLQCCQLLLEHGANPATKCGEAVTALHLAASGGGHFAICKLLIDHLAPVNSRSAKKQTPLCLAAQKGYSNIAQVLLDSGADPNNQDEGKYTPLHLAASNGHLQTVNILLSHGAIVDSTTRNEVTPLHYAVQGGHSQVVHALISSGAKVNCSKKPLLLIAADDGKLDIVNLLLNADALIGCRANIRAVLDKETEVCDYLTPLHLAASKNHHEVLDALIRRGANVNELTTKSGWSALDFAVLNGHSESAIILLQHGAIVSDTCKSIGRNNWTLVQYAASHGSKDVVRLLIQRIKEQRASGTNMSSSVDAASASSLAYPSVPKSNPTRPLPETHVSGGPTKNRYSMNENVHTCSACSKFRPSSGKAQSSSSRYSSTNVSVMGQDLSALQTPEKVEGFVNSSVPDAACSSETSTKHPLSRRKVVKDERQNTLHTREIKKRETEAREARGRLEEAISQRSVPKLTEAISHVSKLVLHLAASAGCDANGHSDHGDSLDHNPYNGTYGHVGHARTPKQKHGSNPSNSCFISAPIAMELGLGNEVQKARKILASLLAEEKRVREEKEKEVLDSKRENAQQTVKKAIGFALDGGDPRSLSRAVNRATKNILDIDDPVVVEATRISVLLSELEKYEQTMRNAIDSEDVESLEEALSELRNRAKTLNDLGGAGATTRIFRGKESEEAIAKAENAMRRLREKREREEAEQLEAIAQEGKVNEELQEVMKLDDIRQLENTICRACEVLTSKHSALANTIEAAKKVKARRLKMERRKLRQASSTNDPLKIEEAVSIAEKFGLTALRHDVETAKAHAEKLREQAAATEDLKHAMSRADVNALTLLRAKLNSLGMFSEAEIARSEIEGLQRAKRAGTLLETALKEATTLYEHVMFLLDDSKAVDEVMTDLCTWTWPDVQRLSDLSGRARQHGSVHNSICEASDTLVKKLMSVGQRLLEVCLESSDARAIAATITGFDRTFTAAMKSNEIDCKGCEKVVSAAKQHLAHVQAMDQASVKAESAQVKVEYALATSRRSAARNRQVKGGVVPRSGGQVVDENPVKSKLGEVLRISDSQVCSSGVSAGLAENESLQSGAECIIENSQPPQSTDEYSTTSVRRAGFRAQAREDSAFRDSLETASAASSECSHFYLFKEGNTVCCARCGNHRNSSNPEWLARVKKRGSTIPQDIFSEWSEPLDVLQRADHQTNLRGLLASNISTTLDTRGERSSLDQGYAKARVTNTPLVQASSQGFPHLLSSMETSRNAPLRSHTGNVNDMLQFLQEHTRSQSVQSGVSHRFRARGQQIPSSSTTMNPTPNTFHVDMSTAVSLVRPDIRVSGPETVTSFRQSRIPSNPPRISGLHGSAAGMYGVSDGALGLNTNPSQRPNEMGSHLGTQGLQMDGVTGARPDVGHMNDLGVVLQTNAVSISEDMVEAGRDLCSDFENENFGFDIAAIVDEPAPLRKIL